MTQQKPFSHQNKKGDVYYLNAKDVQLKKGTQKIYYFSKAPTEFSIPEVPVGRVVFESDKTGLPFLKKAI